MITPEERHQIELAILRGSSPVAALSITALASVVDAIVEARLRKGPLPEGWTRREEGCFVTFRRTGLCHSKCPGGSLCCCPRTVITGP